MRVERYYPTDNGKNRSEEEKSYGYDAGVCKERPIDSGGSKRIEQETPTAFLRGGNVQSG